MQTHKDNFAIERDNKMYCRDKQMQEIRLAYQRVKTKSQDVEKVVGDSTSSIEFICIEGKSGTGKTSLAYGLRDIVVDEDGGYFLHGKVDKVQPTKPYLLFTIALNDFCNSVLSRGTDEISRIRNSINSQISSELYVLKNIVPSLDSILNIKPFETETHLKMSKNQYLYDTLYGDTKKRFQYVFRMFLFAIASAEKPIVFVLDDVQWADESSLELLNSVFQDDSFSRQGVLFVALYRDDECTDSVKKFLYDWKNCLSINQTTISLSGFTLDETITLVTSILRVESSSVVPLATWIHSTTDGNVLFILEYLNYLCSNKLLQFNSSLGSWSWGMELISTSNPYSLHEIIMLKLKSLPAKSQEVVKCASCIGHCIDEKILLYLFPFPDSQHVQILADIGFVKYDGSSRSWKFTHDSIQEAAYSTIHEENKPSFHYNIGRTLWKEVSLKELDEHIFVIVGQLLSGVSLSMSRKERTAISKLALRAGEKSVQLSNFPIAYGFLNEGIALLELDAWDDEYELCVNLHIAAAEVAYCNCDFISVYKYIEIIQQKSRSIEHTVQAHTIKMYALGTSGHLQEAIETGISVLRSLGEFLPKRGHTLFLLLQLGKVRRLLKGKSDEDLLNLPLMKDPIKLSILKILNTMCTYAYFTHREFAGLICLRIVCITLESGLSVMSYLGFVSYGMILCCLCNRIDEGFRYGQIGLQIYLKFDMKQWTGRAFAAYYGLLQGVKLPLKDAIEPLKYAYKVSMENGDIENAFLNAGICLWFQLFTCPLSDVKKDVKRKRKLMEMYGQVNNLLWTQPLALSIYILAGEQSIGDQGFDTLIDKLSNTNTENADALPYAHFHRMYLCYLFRRIDEAYKHAKFCMKTHLVGNFSPIDLVFNMFFFALIDIARSRRSRRHRVPLAWKCLKRLRKRASPSMLSMVYLIEAEIASLRKNSARAASKYLCATTVAKERGLLLEIALSTELHAKFLLRIGEYEQSKDLFQEALNHYEFWGATGMVDQLKEEVHSVFAVM